MEGEDQGGPTRVTRLRAARSVVQNALNLFLIEFRILEELLWVGNRVGWFSVRLPVSG